MPPGAGHARTILHVRMLGGLGNQLFQYAAGLAAARRWGAELALDLTSGDRGSARHPRRFMLDAFGIAAPHYAPDGMERLLWKLRTSRAPRLRRLVSLARADRSVTHFDELRVHSADRRLDGPPPRGVVSMVGYRQCAAYAAACEDVLRQELTFRHPPDGANTSMLDRIRGEPAAVSVHIRRGDYLQLSGSPVLDPAYYRDAVRAIAARVANPRFFVFSDTPAWAREALPLDHPTVIVDGNGEDAAVEDLRLMAACRHHIIANSSFSWWAPWLAPPADRIVVAPKYWMMTPDTHYPELFPPSWTILENLS
ncbi:MAG TPA: alpha-1,2-fucosyltransferase [Azospirillum sp.]